MALADYLIKSKIFHGLTTTQARQLAYEMAEGQLSMPQTLEEKKLAGADWLNGFLKRKTTLSIRTPEAISLAHGTAFNKYSVNELFNLLEGLILKLKETEDRIFNLDEAGLTTVQKVPKVISAKDMKQVGQVTSRDCGELEAVCGIVSATVVCHQQLPFQGKTTKTFSSLGPQKGRRS